MQAEGVVEFSYTDNISAVADVSVKREAYRNNNPSQSHKFVPG
jgi:hypothetical protein